MNFWSLVFSLLWIFNSKPSCSGSSGFEVSSLIFGIWGNLANRQSDWSFLSHSWIISGRKINLVFSSMSITTFSKGHLKEKYLNYCKREGHEPHPCRVCWDLHIHSWVIRFLLATAPIRRFCFSLFRFFSSPKEPRFPVTKRSMQIHSTQPNFATSLLFSILWPHDPTSTPIDHHQMAIPSMSGFQEKSVDIAIFSNPTPG